jgi:hypothetical protein
MISISIWDGCPTFASPGKARHHLSHRQTISETGKANDRNAIAFFGRAD